VEFAPAIVDKLRERAARFKELTEQLGDQEVASNPRRLTTVLKERGPLEPSAKLAERLEKLLASRTECEKLLGDPDSDPDLRELAEAELEELAPDEERLDQEMRAALVTDEEEP